MTGHFGEFPAVESFHREMAERLVQTGRLAMITIRVDGQIVAASCGYHFGPRTHAMFRGYRNDEPWHRYGLGRMLHCQLAREAIERGSRAIESGRGAFDYKMRLGGRLCGERSLVIVRRGWSSRLRLWAGLRAAYLVHVVYGRIWLDKIAPRLGVRKPARHAYVRSLFLCAPVATGAIRPYARSRYAGGRGRPPAGQPCNIVSRRRLAPPSPRFRLSTSATATAAGRTAPGTGWLS